MTDDDIPTFPDEGWSMLPLLGWKADPITNSYMPGDIRESFRAGERRRACRFDRSP